MPGPTTNLTSALLPSSATVLLPTRRWRFHSWPRSVSCPLIVDVVLHVTSSACLCCEPSQANVGEAAAALALLVVVTLVEPVLPVEPDDAVTDV